MPSPLPLLLLALLAGCESGETQPVTPCDVEILAFKPAEGRPGDELWLRARPLTELYDTAVYFDGTRATLLGLERHGCSACDDCLEEQDCDRCEDCDACDPDCKACVESLTLLLPELDAGVHRLVLYNRHGQSAPVDYRVLAPRDTGGGDTGGSDTAGGDTSAPDTSGADTANTDTAGPDTGMPDTGDSGQADTSAPDTGDRASDKADL